MSKKLVAGCSPEYWEEREKEIIARVRAHYELLSSIGVDQLKEFAGVCEETKKTVGHHGYWESAKKWSADCIRHSDGRGLKEIDEMNEKLAQKIEALEWKP